MNRRLLRAEWETFRDRVIHKDASLIQKKEMKLAFYGGASALFGLIINILDPKDSEPTEEDIKALDEIYREMEQFTREIQITNN